MARIKDTTIQGILVVLVVILIFYMILSFGGFEAFSVVNVRGADTVLAGDQEDYEIDLRTVDPEQFRTDTHFREQFGRWRLEDQDGNRLTGRDVQIEQGVFNQIITINIPFGYPTLFLVAEIIEFQHSAATSDGSFIVDDGTIRVQEILTINIIECTLHSECNVPGACLGKFGFCENSLCELRGECRECISNDDCIDADTEYECINFACEEIIQPTFIDTVRETFSEPITEPGKVPAGESPQPKQASTALTAGVVALILILVILVMRRRS